MPNFIFPKDSKRLMSWNVSTGFEFSNFFFMTLKININFNNKTV